MCQWHLQNTSTNPLPCAVLCSNKIRTIWAWDSLIQRCFGNLKVTCGLSFANSHQQDSVSLVFSWKGWGWEEIEEEEEKVVRLEEKGEKVARLEEEGEKVARLEEEGEVARLEEEEEKVARLEEEEEKVARLEEEEEKKLGCLNQ